MIETKFRYLAFILALLMAFKESDIPTVISQPIYYGMCIFLSFVFLLAGNIRINHHLFVLIFILLLGLLMNNIPAHFRATERLIGFTVVLLFLGPLIFNNLLIEFRKEYLVFLLKIILVIVIASSIGYITRIYPGSGRGGYTGLFMHAQRVSGMAAISIITVMYLRKSGNKWLNKLYIYFMILGLCFISAVLGASRAALAGGIIAVSFFLYLESTGKLLQVAKISLVLSFLLIVSFPLWSSYTDRLMVKMNTSKEENNLLYSREAIWKDRIKEFNSSPIFGIGIAHQKYSSLNINFIKNEGNLEPGSSYLAILAMSGIIGTFLVLTYFVTLFLKIWKFAVLNKNNDPFISYLGALLVYFLVHMTTEGYIFASGSILFMLFWTIAANIEGELSYGKEQF